MFGKCFIFRSNLNFNVSNNGKTLLLFSHLLQAVSDFSFCGLKMILRLITNHFIFWISQKRISIFLNIYANYQEFLKAKVK